jgi:hypothetical protein
MLRRQISRELEERAIDPKRPFDVYLSIGVFPSEESQIRSVQVPVECAQIAIDLRATIEVTCYPFVAEI